MFLNSWEYFFKIPGNKQNMFWITSYNPRNKYQNS